MRKRRPLLIILALLLVFLGLNSYVLSGLRLLFPSPIFIGGFWLFIFGIMVLFGLALGRMRSGGMGGLFKVATHSFLILLAASLGFAAVLCATDIYRFFYALTDSVSAGAFILPARSLYSILFALLIFGLIIALFIHGMWRGKYAYRVIRHNLSFDSLPAAFDGFRIVQISDVHAGSFTRPKAVQRGIDLIKQQQADLFVFTGDLVNNRAEEMAPWLSLFSQIRAPYGQFSVLGNHDYGDYVSWPSEAAKQQNLEQLKQYHADIGYRLLLDEHTLIRREGAELVLAGVENWGLGFGERGDLKKALAGAPPEAFKVLLSHDPSHWESEVKHYPSPVQLTLSGHTHGMQFGLETFGIKWSPVKYRYPHWAGLKETMGRVLNINRGFGFLGFSGRVGIWPEITVITLKANKNSSF